MNNRHYATIDHLGTGDEITICAPQGEVLSLISFWDGRSDAARANETAHRIVGAMNARGARQPAHTVKWRNAQPSGRQ